MTLYFGKSISVEELLGIRLRRVCGPLKILGHTEIQG